MGIGDFNGRYFGAGVPSFIRLNPLAAPELWDEQHLLEHAESSGELLDLPPHRPGYDCVSIKPEELHEVRPELWADKMPEGLIELLMRPGKKLIVGDAPGDADCFLSSLALARALRSLGVDAVAHVAADPPLEIASLIEPGEMLTSEQVADDHFASVVFVDNDGLRVGEAAKKAAKDAGSVAIIDHHHVKPSHETLGLKADDELIVFNDPRADAAAQLVLATVVVAARSEKKDIGAGRWSEVLNPLAAAMYSDTRGFRDRNTKGTTMALLRYLMNRELIDPDVAFSGFERPLPQGAEAALKTLSIVYEGKEPATAHGRISADAMATALGETLKAHPKAGWSDVLFSLLNRLETATSDDELAFLSVEISPVSPEVFAKYPDVAAKLQAAFPFEFDPGKTALTKISIRSKSAHIAPALARHMGGGGKDGQAGGLCKVPCHAVNARAERWMNHWRELNTFVNLRVMGH